MSSYIQAPRIDYQKIADAEAFYTSHGFNSMSVPWIISYESYSATRPPNTKEFYCLNGYLNASGEQSFLDLMIDGHSITKHCCITPCFREEPTFDEYHHRYFLKLELIDTDATQENLEKMILIAKTYMDQYMDTPTKVITTNKEETAFDIIDSKSGIELGSYGIRHYKNFSWIYGTGLALPRFDTVITNNKNTHV